MKNKKTKHDNEMQDLLENSFNGNFTAIPKDMPTANVHADPDLVATTMDFGDMNLEDAMESGYTDEEGRAISSDAKGSTESFSTGAYTDLGAGRSAVVHRHGEERR